jgi:hypothetical protein
MQLRAVAVLDVVVAVVIVSDDSAGRVEQA